MAKLKYTVTRNVTIDGKDYVEGDVVKLTEEEANSRSRVENGSLVLVTEPESEESEPTPEVEPVFVESAPSSFPEEKIKRETTPERLEDIKKQAAGAKEAGRVAPKVTNEERNFQTGQNVVGVNSPDPIVGETVPVDIVMPGQVVDPRTGKVLEGGGNDLSTPTPLAPTYAQSLPEIRRANKAARLAANDNK
jgi:hypothetical protein